MRRGGEKRMKSEVGIKRGCTRGSSTRKCAQRIWASLKGSVPFPLVRRTVLLLHCIGSRADLRTLPRIVGGSHGPLYTVVTEVDLIVS
jgi:hypothetical protein